MNFPGKDDEHHNERRKDLTVTVPGPAREARPPLPFFTQSSEASRPRRQGQGHALEQQGHFERRPGVSRGNREAPDDDAEAVGVREGGCPQTNEQAEGDEDATRAQQRFLHGSTGRPIVPGSVAAAGYSTTSGDFIQVIFCVWPDRAVYWVAMLYYLLVAVYILICALLLVVVLLQQGKGGDIAAAFGGAGSQTAFGARSGATFLTRATAVLGALFILGSLGLGMLQKNGAAGSVMSGVAAPAAPKTAAPALPTSSAPPVPATPPSTSGTSAGSTPPASAGGSQSKAPVAPVAKKGGGR